MSMTLLESAKIALNNGETKRAGVIAMFAELSAWLRVMRFMSIQGNAYAYNREGALPGVAFRGIGESYPESTGIINPQAEALRIAGGDLDVDTAIVKMHGMGVRATHEAMKIKALAAAITYSMIKGDSETNPREFDGLQKRVTGAQLIENGGSSGGDPLSLAKLDEAIEAVPGANGLLIPRPMRARFTAAMRNQTISGNIMQSKDEFGRTVTTYNDIPLLAAYPDNDGVDPLSFTEAGGGGGSTAASIYVCRFGDGFLNGIQNGEMEVRDLGELDAEPKMRTRVEWLMGMAVEHGRAVARLRGISNAAIAA
jgi:hypothetical protein